MIITMSYYSSYFPGHRYFTNPKPLEKPVKEDKEKKEVASQENEGDREHRKETDRTSVDAV